MSGIQLQYYENFKYRDQILEKLYEKFGSDTRKGTTHVSDLVYCLHKKFWRSDDDYEKDLTSDSILYFVRGRSLGDMLEKIFDKQEVKVEHAGVVGHIDAVDEELEQVIEIKTAKSIYKDVPTEAYQTQLRYYMAMYDTQIGHLMYYVITTNQLRVFTFYATKEQLRQTLEEIEAKKKLLDLSKEMNDPSIMPMSDKDSFECKVCDCYRCPNYGGTKNGKNKKTKTT